MTGPQHETNRKHLAPRGSVMAMFVSDIHLSDTMPHTMAAFLHFLKEIAPHTQQLYLLGDLFEYWPGDDDAEDALAKRVIQALKRLTDLGIQLFWIGGNRDFLLGDAFAQQCGMTLLPDPFVANIDRQRVMLSHGDYLCTDDIRYMQFRQMVRQSDWQQAFLQKPLAERKAIIQGMREASMRDQQQKSLSIMDVNQDAVRAAIEANSVNLLVHGHTHRPAQHQESWGTRFVLSDWDFDQAKAQRGGYLSYSPEQGFLVHQAVLAPPYESG